MTSTQTETDTLLSDKEVALLNEARSLLQMIVKRSSARASGEKAHSYGIVFALADTAQHMIFETLNWTNACGIQPLTDDDLFNRLVAEVQS